MHAAAAAVFGAERRLTQALRCRLLFAMCAPFCRSLSKMREERHKLEIQEMEARGGQSAGCSPPVSQPDLERSAMAAEASHFLSPIMLSPVAL